MDLKALFRRITRHKKAAPDKGVDPLTYEARRDGQDLPAHAQFSIRYFLYLTSLFSFLPGFFECSSFGAAPTGGMLAGNV